MCIIVVSGLESLPGDADPDLLIQAGNLISEWFRNRFQILNAVFTLDHANQKRIVLDVGILNVEDLEEKFEAVPSMVSSNFYPVSSEGMRRLKTNLRLRMILPIKPALLSTKRPTYKLQEQSGESKTKKLNLDRDRNKLWKLTQAMNDEETR